LLSYPPSGLAFGEPDDRHRRGTQYAAAYRLFLTAVEYWVARSSCAETRFALLPGDDNCGGTAARDDAGGA